MTSRNNNNWRGKLLVDLSTGNISNQNQKESCSEPFYSNAYDPFKIHQLGSEQDLSSEKRGPEAQSSTSLSDVTPHSLLDKNFIPLDSSLLQASFPDCMDAYDKDYNKTYHAPTSPVNEIALIEVDQPSVTQQVQKNLITVANSSGTTPPTTSNQNVEEIAGFGKDFSSSEVNSEVSNAVDDLILDELTGLFKPRDYNDNELENHLNNFILDDQTGEIIIINQEPNTTQESESNINILEHKKDRIFNKNQRVKGREYIGRKIEKSQDQDKPLLTFVGKERRKMRPKLCSHSLRVAKTTRSFLCANISEDERCYIFDYFWDLESWEGKKAYLKNLIRIRSIIRRRKSTVDDHKKELGFDCFLPNTNNELVRVCKTFFLSTLGMNNETLSEWIKSINDTVTSPTATRRSKSKKVSEIRASVKSDSVMEWLDILPKMPSHYCRASSKRVYVEDTFRSKTHMFKVYQKWCNRHGKAAAKRKLFISVLKCEKISIFKPRKDQCDTCTAFKEGNIEAEVYEEHNQKKEEAYRAKEQAKSLCSQEVLVVTMDVQSVLLCPKMKVSVQYYKQKLQIHNFTLYINNDREVHLYVWHEGDGGVTANEFTTCLVDFISSKVNEGYKKVILISDGCCYQNRNKILSAALANLSKVNNTEIEQIILEKGHTMMEVDSVHSTLEHLFKPPLFAPSDYINLMAQARPTKPYIIHHVDFTFFKNHEQVCHLDSMRPGKRAGDPVVTDIRGLLYKNGEIFYKLRHPQEWQLLPQRVRAINTNLSNVYTEPRKLEKSKYQSLQSLKKYMHRDHHHFYDNLHHN